MILISLKYSSSLAISILELSVVFCCSPFLVFSKTSWSQILKVSFSQLLFAGLEGIYFLFSPFILYI